MKRITVLVLISLFQLQVFAQKVETVSTNEIKSQVYFLASDEMQGRKNGSPQIDIAASYLANTLVAYGVNPGGENGSYYQEVPMQRIAKASHMSVTAAGIAFEKIIPITLSNPVSYEGEWVFLNYGLEGDYSDRDLSGKVVVVRAGKPGEAEPGMAFASIMDKQKLAKEKGAIGLVELMLAPDEFFQTNSANANVEKVFLRDTPVDSFFHIWVQDPESILVNGLAEKPSNQTRIVVEGMAKNLFMGRNVVGRIDGTDPVLKEEFILFSAHYDHLGTKEGRQENDLIYNGARDNTVGVSAVLNLAKNFALDPPKRSALIVFFTGEEVGLLGSKWYSEHPPVPMKQIVFCFNNDNSGYNDTSIATVVGLSRSSAGKNILLGAEQSGLKAVDVAPQLGALFYFSDNVNFSKFGIPSATFSMGFSDFDEEINKHYHQVSDTADSLDYAYLNKFIHAFVKAGRLLAEDGERPAWSKDDEFYQKGQQLYGTP